MVKTASLSDIQSQARDWLESLKPSIARVPVNAQPVTQIASVQAPAYGAANAVLILTYTVQANWAVLFDRLVLGYQSAPGNPAPLPGDITWSISIDRLPGTLDGYFERDYGEIQMPLGSFVGGPMWPILFRHRDLEALRITAVTNQNVATGPGSFISAGIFGYEWPEGMD